MAKPYFHYTDNRAVLHTIPVGMGGCVEVVGDPENAAYEWLIRKPAGVTDHSDCGYGGPEIALRDGLIAYLGLPA